MTPFLLKAPSDALVFLLIMPLFSLALGFFIWRKTMARLYESVLFLCALCSLGFALFCFQEMYWGGAYNEMDIAGETGARLLQEISFFPLQLSLSPFETLAILLLSLWVAVFTLWQTGRSTPDNYGILLKQNALWLGLCFMMLSSTLFEMFFIYLAGSLIVIWQNAKLTIRPATTWLFIQHRLGDFALGCAALILFLAYDTNNPELWLFRASQSPLKPFYSGFFEGFYVDQMFRPAAFLVFLTVLSRLGLGSGIKKTEAFLSQQNEFLKPFILWFFYGGALLILVKSFILHVNLEWHLAWALIAFLIYAIYLAAVGFKTKTLKQADFYLQMSFFIFTVVATIPYDNTAGLILILIFFSAIPLLSITRINILNAVKQSGELSQLSGLWRVLRSEERIRMLLSFSLTPLLLSPTFYASFLWADWAVSPFFRYGLWALLTLWSFIFTAAVFRPLFLIFTGDVPSHSVEPSPKNEKLRIGFIAFLTLLLAIGGNLLCIPVHRLQGLIQANYAPLLNWLSPESNTGFFIVSSFQYALDVLAQPKQQWTFYAFIWGAALLGWLASFIQFKVRKNALHHTTDKVNASNTPSALSFSLTDGMELLLLRISFLVKRIIQPLIAGGLLWHLWRAPSSLLRFFFWLFHNGDPRKSLSLFLVLVSVGLYFWGHAP